MRQIVFSIACVILQIILSIWIGKGTAKHEIEKFKGEKRK